MKVIETMEQRRRRRYICVWIEHRLWRWLRHQLNRLMYSLVVFELSTAYEGDWDESNQPLHTIPGRFELSTAYEGDWDSH